VPVSIQLPFDLLCFAFSSGVFLDQRPSCHHSALNFGVDVASNPLPRPAVFFFSFVNSFFEYPDAFASEESRAPLSFAPDSSGFRYPPPAHRGCVEGSGGNPARPLTGGFSNHSALSPLQVNLIPQATFLFSFLFFSCH